jgi:hypothetical protein
VRELHSGDDPPGSSNVDDLCSRSVGGEDHDDFPLQTVFLRHGFSSCWASRSADAVVAPGALLFGSISLQNWPGRMIGIPQ